MINNKEREPREDDYSSSPTLLQWLGMTAVVALVIIILTLCGEGGRW